MSADTNDPRAAPAKRPRAGRDFIARHGETVFNAARRFQGEAAHTPLTRAGFAQADAMGRVLAAYFGAAEDGTCPVRLWCSPAGRALQTLAIIVEHLGCDWHAARTDARLVEIGLGAWGGRHHAEIVAEGGPVLGPRGLFVRAAPGGESYAMVAERLAGWLALTDDDDSDRLVIMHGMSSRVLRGMMTGYAVDPDLGAGVADDLPQGSVVMIAGGVETVIHRGTGRAPA